MVARSGYTVYACAILPEHVHMVLGRYRYPVETMVRLLKAEASHELIVSGLHPLAAWPERDGSLPAPWARKCWKVFLYEDTDIQRATHYVEDNPLKEGKRRQRWSFVTPFAVTPG